MDGRPQRRGDDELEYVIVYEDTDPAKTVELMSTRVTYERGIGHPDAEANAERVAQIRARIEI